MRDPSHMKKVEEWALFVKNNPLKWKNIHTEFIDAQFKKSFFFFNRLSKQPGGKKKILKLFNIKNKKGYPSLSFLICFLSFLSLNCWNINVFCYYHQILVLN